MRSLAFALLTACSSTVVMVDPPRLDAAADATPDVPSPDVPSPDVPSPDVMVATECRSAADCAAQPPAGSLRFCEGQSRWSCVAGRCTWRCASAPDCDVDRSGCLRCGSAPPVCASTACTLPAPSMARVEETLCARDFVRSIARCNGGFVQLTDGTWCALDELPTGALRAALACGRCQTSLMW